MLHGEFEDPGMKGDNPQIFRSGSERNRGAGIVERRAKRMASSRSRWLDIMFIPAPSMRRNLRS